ncbi:hypothetical protein FBQ95_12030 [Chloroflexi bacterium CFX3]|nr:hypothetical protein [Chloroflexi bacterium CFX3]
MKRRSYQLVWLGGILALAAALIVPVFAQSGTPTQIPVIRAEYEGVLFEGVAGSACFPKADNAPLCTFVDDPQPTNVINAREDQAITFVIAPADPAPQAFSIAFIDGAPPNAEPPTRDLLATDGVLSLENVSPNRQRILITAVYPGSGGQGEFFVSYVFALQVQPRPTATPTFTATPTATLTATPTITPTFTATPTATPTVAASATPTRRATQPARTPESGTPALTETPTEAVGTPDLSVTVATLPPAPTPELAGTLPPAPTPELAGTLPPAPTPTPFTIRIPTRSALLPTATLAPLSEIGYPNMQIIIGDVAFAPIALVGCLTLPTEQQCLSTPLDAPINRVVGAPGSITQLQFGGVQPAAVVVNLFESNGIDLIGSQVLSLNPIPVYILPIEAGSYVLGVEVVWAEGNATYFFRLVVGGEN